MTAQKNGCNEMSIDMISTVKRSYHNEMSEHHQIHNLKYDIIIGGLKDTIAKLEDDSTLMANDSKKAQGNAAAKIKVKIDTCCSVLQCVAVCCSVLQCIAVCCSALQCAAVCCSVLQYAAVCCSALQCVAVCCGVL